MLKLIFLFLKAILREVPMYAPKQQKLFATLDLPEDDLCMWFCNTEKKDGRPDRLQIAAALSLNIFSKARTEWAGVNSWSDVPDCKCLLRF